MTENKRFHFGYVLGDTGLIDEQTTEVKWFIENCCSVSDLKKNWKTVCDKLNEVADENEQLKQREQTLTAKIDRILHQRDGNEKQHLKVMSYLHDNYYSIWEECLKELGD